jgi:hypothetical protein
MPGVTYLPMVAEDGVLFVPQIGGGIYAFPTDCGTDNAACAPLWTWGTGKDGNASVRVGSVTVTDGRVFAASKQGDLFVFALPAATSVSASKNSGGVSAGVGLAAMVGLAGILFLLARRRARSITG